MEGEIILTEDWKSNKEAQKIVKKERTAINKLEIETISGYEIEVINDYQYRVNGKLDLFPTNKLFHFHSKNIRGKYQNPLEIIEKYIKIKY